MAFDDTPPRSNLIFVLAALSVVTLFGLAFAFRSYFQMMAEDEIAEKVLTAPTPMRDAVVAEEQAALREGTPIEQAAEQRLEVSASVHHRLVLEEVPDPAELGVAVARDHGELWLCEERGGMHAFTSGAAAGAARPGTEGSSGRRG
jgi:hypothetical protein